MKTSHTRGLNSSELNFCINCLSFSSVAKVQMYRVYCRIVFKRLRQHPLTMKLVIGALLAYADKGMITPEDLPHFVTGQHDKVGSLAFLWSNNSILTCLFYLWLSLVEKKCLDFWLHFGFFYQVAGSFFFRYRFLYNLIRNSEEEI